MEQPQLLQRATPEMGVVGAGLSGAALELANRVDGVAGDHEVTVAKPADAARVPERLPRGERQPAAPVAEEVERAPEAGVGVDAGPVEIDQPVVEGIVVV